jgi:hypothetical protein
MTDAGLAKIEAAKLDGPWNALDSLEALEIPPDLVKALSANKTAKQYFEATMIYHQCWFRIRDIRMKKDSILPILALMALLACKSITSPATPTPVVPLPRIILTEVLQKFDDCRSQAGVEAEGNTYSFSCNNSADTFYTVSMTRNNSEAAAHTQFESSRGDNPALCFHGYDLYEVFSQNSSNQYIVQEQLGWLAGQWVFSIYASYDYDFAHFNAISFSEAVYTSGVEHDLLLAGTCP